MRTSPIPGLEVLADALWTERRVVEYLLFKLTTAKLLLAADERRFVAHSLEEIERVLDRLREAEGHRRIALATVASAWGLDPDDLTLADLAERAPVPFGAVFREHHTEFERLVGEIEETANANRLLVTGALNHARATLDALTGAGESAGMYTASGAAGPSSSAAHRLDEVL